MVKTKSEVKIKIKDWIEQQNKPFTTNDVKQEISSIATNIRLSPNRLAKFIQATGAAEFNKSKKIWMVRLKPKTRLSQD